MGRFEPDHAARAHRTFVRGLRLEGSKRLPIRFVGTPSPETLDEIPAMAAASLRKGNARLPPEVNRALFVRNLPFNISSEEMYDIFGKYGAIRQIRLGNGKDTRGTAYVVYEDIYDAKNAVDHLSGFNVANRYLIVLYYQPTKMGKKTNIKQKEDEITRLQEKYGIGSKTPSSSDM
ncbi:hypothetical protein BRADI_1g04240v3 [Brachypodium distachyon]|uniref:RRM domain-containing protein n=1 Tax=Brachypodium distachyon TaxID=15368 RepID=A0A0Q3RGZ0_BRADI|nr:hypothetical protein BRADI_1g04240v3 [Brachypodium distachyon]